MSNLMSFNATSQLPNSVAEVSASSEKTSENRTDKKPSNRPPKTKLQNHLTFGSHSPYHEIPLPTISSLYMSSLPLAVTARSLGARVDNISTFSDTKRKTTKISTSSTQDLIPVVKIFIFTLKLSLP